MAVLTQGLLLLFILTITVLTQGLFILTMAVPTQGLLLLFILTITVLTQGLFILVMGGWTISILFFLAEMVPNSCGGKQPATPAGNIVAQRSPEKSR